MANQPRRRHYYALALAWVPGGFLVEHVTEHRSEAEAYKHSLTLLARYGDVEAVTLDHEVVEGDILMSTEVWRWP